MDSVAEPVMVVTASYQGRVAVFYQVRHSLFWRAENDFQPGGESMSKEPNISFISLVEQRMHDIDKKTFLIEQKVSLL